MRVLKEKGITDPELYAKADTSGDGDLDLDELRDCLEKIGGF